MFYFKICIFSSAFMSLIHLNYYFHLCDMSHIHLFLTLEYWDILVPYVGEMVIISIDLPWLLYSIPTDLNHKTLFLDSQFCSINLYVYPYTSTTLLRYISLESSWKFST
jgi:hypothetical protein